MKREEPSAPAPSSVRSEDKQAEEDLWQHHKAERGVWTKPMLAALARGLKGNKWFSLIDKVSTERTLQLAWEKVRRNAGACGVELFREQTTDAMLDGCHMSGVIDRLHLHRNAAGEVTRVEIIDHKTDAVNQPEELLERYAGQMNAYREAMRMMYPAAEVECVLLSVRHGVLIGA